MGKNKVTEKELYYHFGWLHKVITESFGKRCPDFDKDCVVCQMWQLYDDLREAQE